MYRIGSLTLDPGSREILSGDEVISAEPQVFDLILTLLRNRHRVVTKDELVDLIWDGRAISDSTITSCVKAARRALGDDGKRQEFIRTVQRRGFRFVADVDDLVRPAPLDQSEASYGIDLTLPQQPSVAVLPFDVLGDDAEAATIAKGLVRDITLGLARTRWLFVTAEASARRFDFHAQEPKNIGKSLGVRYLLGGSFQKQGARIRVTVTVVDAVRGSEIWSQRFERKIDDIFELLDEIASVVVSTADAQINHQERERVSRSPIEMLDAWGAYHAAIDLLRRFTRENVELAAGLLDRAAGLEPGSGHIVAAQSYLWWQRAFLEISDNRSEDISRAIALAHDAVGLDPMDAHAHWALGRAEMISGDHDLALERFATATELNPSFAQGHYNLAWTHRLTGRAAEGLSALDEARRLSPHDPLSFAFMGLKAALHSLGDEPDEAVEWARRSVRQPHCHYHNLAAQALILWRAGKMHEARELMRQAIDQRPGYKASDFMSTAMVPANEEPLVTEGFRQLALG